MDRVGQGGAGLADVQSRLEHQCRDIEVAEVGNDELEDIGPALTGTLEGPARFHRPIGSLSTKPVPADEMIVPFASRMLIGSPVRAFGTSRTEDHPPK
jgi:hypothetical protein